MRKRRTYVIMIAVGVLVGALAVVLLPSWEPSYEGKRLSEWVDSYSYSIDRGQYTPKQRDQAILGIGTNALPYLLKWIRYERPAWKMKLAMPVNRIIWRVNPAWEINDQKELRRARGAGRPGGGRDDAGGRRAVQAGPLPRRPGRRPQDRRGHARPLGKCRPPQETVTGKTRPVAPNQYPDGADDPDGRQRNRRVEVVINTCN